MIDFDLLYDEYENTRNVCEFCEKYKENMTATRFLLIRSLDKNHLKDMINTYSNAPIDGRIRSLAQTVYDSSVTIEQLVSYIEAQRSKIIEQRSQELDGLQNVLAKFPVVNCGVRNDRIDDVVKKIVRNKSLKTVDALEHELDDWMLPRIRQYSMWSYYNQTANDIIELFFLKHKAILPTLRKIHDIDFFIKTGNTWTPFDLKFTHISDSYFDLASQGIQGAENSYSHDDFYVNTSVSSNESKEIRSYYSTFKHKHKSYYLPNMRNLSKNELINYLADTGDSSALSFVREISAKRADYVPKTHEELYPLEWWNYKFQGERLFCNNNRLFVFITYLDKIVDGRELKGKTAEIGEKINNLLDNLSENDFHSIHYHYDKESGLTGNYTALSLSTIYYE